MKTKLFAAFAMLSMLISCNKKKDDFNIPSVEESLTENLIEIESKTVDGLTVTLFATEELFVGYNKLYFIVKKDADELVTTSNFTLLPMMEMPMHSHTTPLEDGVSENALMVNKNVLFIMPSTAGNWTLDVEFELENIAYNVVFNPTIVEKEESKMRSFVSDSDAVESYFIGLIEPELPVVGKNDFEIIIFKKENMMSFVPVTDLIIEIDPQMPSMGHGSPNNINPVHSKNGHYEGVVNFTMTGQWQVNLVVKSQAQEILKDNLAFDITL